MKKALCFSAAVFLLLLGASPVMELSLFPVDFQKGIFNIAENYPSPVRVQTLGNGEQLAGMQAKLIVDLPSSVVIAAAAAEHPLLEVRQLVFEKRSGDAGRNVYVIHPGAEYFRRMVKSSTLWKNGLLLFLRSSSGTAGRQEPVRLFYESDGKPVSAVKTFSLGIMPPLPVLRPTENFRIGCTGFVSGWLPFPDLFKEHTAFWTSLCRKPLTTVNDTMKFWPQENLDTLAGRFEITLDLPHNMLSEGYPVMEDIHGKKFPNQFCPLFALESESYWNRTFPDFVKRQLKLMPSISYFGNNFESFIEWGACRRCRTDFAKYAKLSAVPEGKELAGGKPLHQAWRKYRAQIRTKVLAKFTSEARKHFPHLKFAVCTIPMEVADEHLNNWCGIDVRAIDRHVDRLTGMFYFTGTKYFDSIRYNAAELKAPQIPYIDPAEPYLRWFEIYTPEKVLQNLIATAALGGQGLYWYPEDIADARYMHLLIRGADAIARAEKYFSHPTVPSEMQTGILNVNRIKVNGKNGQQITIESPDLSRSFRSVVRRNKDGNYVAALFNFSSQKPLFLKVAFPEFSGKTAHVRDLVSGENFAGTDAAAVRKGFTVKLVPDGCALLEITSGETPQDGVTQEALQKELETELLSIRKNLHLYRPLKKDRASVGWELFRKIPVIRLARNNHFILIDPVDRGAIRSWGHQDNHLTNRDGSLDALFFTGLRVPANYQLTPLKTGIDGNTPFVEMSYTVPEDQQAGGDAAPLEKLIFDKRIELVDDRATIRSVYTFTNGNSRPVTLEFRIRNLPVHNWKPVPVPPVIRLADNRKVDSGATFIRPGEKITFKEDGLTAPDDMTVTLDYCGARFTFDAPEFAGWYFHCDSVAWTVEPLSPRFTLRPGEKRKFTVTYRRHRPGEKK